VTDDRSAKPWFAGLGGAIGISIGLAATTWVLDSILDSVIFNEGTILRQILSPPVDEIVVRSLFGFVIIVFGVYIHLNTDRRKRLEEELWQSEKKYRMLVENIQDGVFIIQDAKFQYVNDALARMAGYNVGEIIGRDFKEFVAPDDLKMVADRYHRRQSGENVPSEYEFHMMRKDGAKISVNMSAGIITYGGRTASMGILKDITERKREEKALEEAVVEAVEEKNKSNAIIAALGDGIIIQDTDYKIIYQNKVQNDLFGNRVGEYCYKAYEGRDTICEWCPIEESFKDGKIHKTERCVATDRGTSYVELTGSPLRDSTGKIVGGVKVVRDITELKRTEEELRQRERFLADIFTSIQDGIGIIDKDMKILRINPTVERWYPYITQFIGRKCYEVYHGRSERCEVCPAWRTLKTGESAHDVVPKHEPGGKEDGWAEIYSFPMDTKTGEMNGIIEYVRDITERKKVEKEKDRLLKAINSSTDGITIADEKDRYIYVNAAYAKTFGYAQEELVGKTWREITPPELIGPTEKGLSGTMHNRDVGVFNGEVPGLRKDGTEIPTEVRGTALWDEKGNYLGHICIVRDITERKKVEEKLNLLSEAVDEALDGVIITGLNGFSIYSNKAVEDIYGFSSDELKGKHVSELNADPEFTRRVVLQDIRTKGRWAGEFMAKKKNGQEFPVWLTASIVKDGKGEPIAMVGVIRDITERKRAEEEIKKYTRELEESNRIKELFTDIMHHDLLNPLTTANGFIELLKENEISSRKKAYLESIERSLVKGMELIDGAMKYSRFESLKIIELEELDLKKIIEDVIEALTPLADNAGMEIINRMNLKTPVRANKIIEEVFSNIISNAIKYASSGKRIIIEGENEGESLQVRVIDFGEGIKESDKTMIFERFRRGGKTGVKGSGLGLAIAGKIMELHNGRIWVEDNPEGGSIFIVEIPGI